MTNDFRPYPVFIGLALLGMSGFSYSWRAFTNQRAWNGIAIPAALCGIVILAIALIILYFNYPQ